MLQEVNKPHKPDKGLKFGSCNREACQRPGATWFNRGTDKYYCENCAYSINSANRDAPRVLPRLVEPGEGLLSGTIKLGNKSPAFIKKNPTLKFGLEKLGELISSKDQKIPTVFAWQIVCRDCCLNWQNNIHR